MEAHALIAFAAARLALAAAPGPLVAMIVTRAMSRDMAGATAFAAGFCIGNVLAILTIALGVGAWVAGSPEWLTVLKLCAAAYLFGLALQIWRDSIAGAGRSLDAALPRPRWLPSTGAGVALCLGSPATFVYYLLLLPSVAPEGLTDLATLAAVLTVSLVAVGLALVGTILLASQVHRLLVRPAAQIACGRAMAALPGVSSVSLLAI